MLLRLIELALDRSSTLLMQVVSSSRDPVPLRLFFEEAGKHFGKSVAAIDASAGEFPWLAGPWNAPQSVLQGIASSLYRERSPVLAFPPDEAVGIVHEQACSVELRLGGAGAVFRPRVSACRASGVYFSPSWLVAHVVGAAFASLPRTDRDARPPTVLDPACGAGAFLCGALRLLCDRSAGDPRDADGERERRATSRVLAEPSRSLVDRVRILSESIHGVDLDPISVHRTRVALLLTLLDGEGEGGWPRPEVLSRLLPQLSRQIRTGNSLVDPGARAPCFGVELEGSDFDWQGEFPEVMRRGGFDVVVGNPPYVDAESMTRHSPALRAYCSKRYSTARGNWDLFCVFIERALELQRPGGVQSLLVPNKLASAEYAGGLRRLMRQHYLEKLEDFSMCRAFAADAYPIVFVLKKADSRLEVSGGRPLEALDAPWRLPVTPALPGSERIGHAVSRIAAELDCYEELNLPHVEVCGGATVSEAYALLPQLREAQADDTSALRVANSGTIDRYACHWGQVRMRYLKASFLRPLVSATALGALSPRRLWQARSAKCIVAGLTRSLEVFPDREGQYLAAKSTTVLIPRTAEVSVEYLAAVLNTPLLSQVYLHLFGGLRLGGDYLRVGPPQLRRMPLVVPRTQRELSLAQSLRALSAERTLRSSGENRFPITVETASLPSSGESSDPVIAHLDQSIATIVETLYLERLSAPGSD